MRTYQWSRMIETELFNCKQSPANTQIGDCLTHNGFSFRSLMIDIAQTGKFSSSLEFHPARLGKGRGDHLPCLERGATIFSQNAGMSSNCRSSLSGSFKPLPSFLAALLAASKKGSSFASSHNVKTIRQIRFKMSAAEKEWPKSLARRLRQVRFSSCR